MMNDEQGMLNVEVRGDHSTFSIPCSVFDILYEFFQLLHHNIDLFFGVVFAEGKTYRNLVGVVIDGADDV